MLACLGDLTLPQSAIEYQGTVSLATRQFIPLLSATLAVSYMEQDNPWQEEMLTSAGSRAGTVALSSYYNMQSHWGKIFRHLWPQVLHVNFSLLHVTYIVLCITAQQREDSR